MHTLTMNSLMRVANAGELVGAYGVAGLTLACAMPVVLHPPLILASVRGPSRSMHAVIRNVS